MSRFLPFCLLILLGWPAPVSASVIRCWGGMASADCGPAPAIWAANSQPAFVVGCEACGLLPDGGGACHPHAASPMNFELKVAGQTYRGDAHFEQVGPCAGEQLMRYKGPLVPGETHELVYPGNVDYSQPKRFTVTFEVAKPAPDAGSPAADTGAPAADTGAATADTGAPSADAGAPAAAATAPVPREASGCSHGRGSGSSALVAMAVLLFGLLRRLERRRMTV